MERVKLRRGRCTGRGFVRLSKPQGSTLQRNNDNTVVGLQGKKRKRSAGSVCLRTEHAVLETAALAVRATALHTVRGAYRPPAEVYFTWFRDAQCASYPRDNTFSFPADR